MERREIELFSMKGLRISVDVDGNRVVGARAEGPLSKVASPVMRLIDEFMVKERPAYIGEDFVVPSLFFPPIPSKAFRRAMKTQLVTRLKKKVPEILSVSITDYCTANCPMCGHGERAKEPMLTTEEMKKLIDDALALGTYTFLFTGGDPVLRSDLPELIEYVPNEKAVVIMFTPAQTLYKRAKELKEAGLHSVFVVLHDADPDVHNAMMGTEGAFEKAVRSVKACLDEGILTGIVAILTKERLSHIHELIDFASELGVYELLLSDPLPTGRVLRREDIMLTPEEREFVAKLQEEHNSKGEGVKIFANARVKGCSGVGCVAGSRWLHITSTGESQACDYIPLSFGNIRTNKLSDIWKKITTHPWFAKHTDLCRIQDMEFRKRYFHNIPPNTLLPYPIEKIDSKK
ncbi:hypothetical protein DRN72_00125 [Methanosarcinales archaeon]|nr:MAG: hypothetical protein DRN72_00125 [Methanosarcinales archaeon]